MFELGKLANFLASPLTLAIGLGFASLVCAGRQRYRWANLLASMGVIGIWLAAMPIVAASLAGALERQHPVTTAAAAPHADAIVILGGALATSGSAQINMGGAADRIWHAAALYRAGKAKWVVVAAGGKPVVGADQVEADAIAEMLVTLGVRRTDIRTERTSRNTRENAANLRPILDQLQARRVLLVTSALHMPRALKTFRHVWSGSALEWIPAATDAEVSSRDYRLIKGLLPSASALDRTTRALKEYAGLLALEIVSFLYEAPRDRDF